jgi:hypothetical protein
LKLNGEEHTLNSEFSPDTPYPAKLERISVAIDRGVYWLFLLVFANLVFIIYVNLSYMNDNWRATLHSMAMGTAHRPFVYRQLTPTLVRMIDDLIPISWTQASNPVMVKTMGLMGGAEHPQEALAYLLVMFGFWIGFLAAFRYLMAGLDYSRLQIDVLTWLITPTLLLFTFWSYAYDLSILCLFTLALALMQRQRWDVFLLVFAIASTAKETSILLTFIYFFMYRSWRNRSSWPMLAWQLALYVAWRVPVMIFYAFNPGAVVEYHLRDLIAAYLRHPLDFYHTFLVYGGLLALVLIGIDYKPAFLKEASVMLIPLFILWAFFGMPFEARVFLEAWPVVFLLLFTQRLPYAIRPHARSD